MAQAVTGVVIATIAVIATTAVDVDVMTALIAVSVVIVVARATARTANVGSHVPTAAQSRVASVDRSRQVPSAASSRVKPNRMISRMSLQAAHPQHPQQQHSHRVSKPSALPLRQGRPRLGKKAKVAAVVAAVVADVVAVDVTKLKVALTARRWMALTCLANRR